MRTLTRKLCLLYIIKYIFSFSHFSVIEFDTINLLKSDPCAHMTLGGKDPPTVLFSVYLYKEVKNLFDYITSLRLPYSNENFTAI